MTTLTSLTLTQLSSAYQPSSEEDEESINIWPKPQGLASDQLSPYAQEMLKKTNSLSSASFLQRDTGGSAHAIGLQCSLSLRETLPQRKTEGSASMVVQAIASSSLSKKTGSFSDRRSTDYRQRAAECVGSKEILSFGKSDVRQKILIVSTNLDENNAFDPLEKQTCTILKKLSDSYNVKYITASRIEDVYSELLQLPKKSLSGIVFLAHGSERDIEFDSRSWWDGSFTDTTAAEALADKSFIHLSSCHTANVEGKSPLYRLQFSLNHIGKKILLSAPILRCYANGTKLISIKPVKIKLLSSKDLCKDEQKERPSDVPVDCNSLPGLTLWERIFHPGYNIDVTKTLITEE